MRDLKFCTELLGRDSVGGRSGERIPVGGRDFPFPSKSALGKAARAWR